MSQNNDIEPCQLSTVYEAEAVPMGEGRTVQGDENTEAMVEPCRIADIEGEAESLVSEDTSHQSTGRNGDSVD